jgi:hypothetical protein
VHSSRLAGLAFIFVAPLFLASCGGRVNVALADQCHEQITLSLAPGVSRIDRVMEGLEEEADVRLEYLRSSSPTLFVYMLRSSANDPGCTRALSRLRQDSRVRFAEPDKRRAVHGFVQ